MAGESRYMTDTCSQGGCLCGAVRYEAQGMPIRVANCHCSMCRRHSGAPFLTYVGYPSDRVRFVKGQVTAYRSSDAAARGHCAACGSPLTFIYHADPQTLWLTGGSFDEPDVAAPEEHWFVADKLAWVQLDDGLPQWPGAPGG